MLWAVLSAVLLQVSQTPPRDAAPPGERPAGTGVISGHVVSAEGVPLRGMYVTLVFVDGPSTPRHLETDAEGRFQFTALPKGDGVPIRQRPARSRDRIEQPGLRG